ncbi:hypothetical protein ACUNV4_16805 [Granulosicoccus sp. 3-233]|uniref:hypothetical protein n=1 Tax=Granulosicoccus sp. 3-233 TaxID=3417969 RepID=UPI003D32FD7D
MTAHSHPSPIVQSSVFGGVIRLVRGVCGVAGILALQMVGSVSTPATAAIFKCVSASGDTTYTSAPCAHDESTRRISSSATAVAGLDCRIARKLAFDTTRRMKQGESSESLFDTHGGMDSLSPEVMGLISYIYTFRGNEAVSAGRIATLATERCQVGSFGANVRRCETYPFEFVQQLGGCEAARGESDNIAERAGTDSEQPQALPVAADEPAVGAAVPTRYAAPSAPTASIDDSAARAAATRAVNERASCRQRISETIENTNGRMQNGSSTADQDRIRALHRQLRMQLARC